MMEATLTDLNRVEFIDRKGGFILRSVVGWNGSRFVLVDSLELIVHLGEEITSKVLRKPSITQMTSILNGTLARELVHLIPQDDPIPRWISA